ncbi:MAG TPA: PAS domain-containing sensor histidine kinase [Myxococcales bacterium]
MALIDDLPSFYDHLVAALESPRPREVSADAQPGAAQHGRERALDPAWSLGEVVGEYHLLQAVILTELERGGTLGAEERDIVLEMIATAVGNAIAEFERLRSSEQKERATLSEQRFAQFVEAVRDYAIFTVDPLGFITSWNAGAERLKQYTPAEVIGEHFSMLYPEEGRRRDEPMAHLRAAELEGRFRGEGVRLRKNGEAFLADVSITPIHVDGELRGFTKVVQDLTERNLIMQERDLSRSEAEQLRIAAEYRERFVQALTHDLRTPLQAAKAAAGLIARSPGDETKARIWSLRISDAVDRTDSMISDLLDAALVDAGQAIPLQMVACDLKKVAADAADELRTRHGDRFLLTTDGTTDGHWDAQAMRRVFDNLLGNAVKYGEAGAPVALAIRGVDARVLVTVHNRGMVIPSAEQASLFQPFHRSKAAQATAHRGWGLGLTVVRAIVQGHGGVIKVESYPKDGTTFTIDLPVDARAQ